MRLPAKYLGVFLKQKQRKTKQNNNKLQKTKKINHNLEKHQLNSNQFLPLVLGSSFPEREAGCVGGSRGAVAPLAAEFDGLLSTTIVPVRFGVGDGWRFAPVASAVCRDSSGCLVCTSKPTVRISATDSGCCGLPPLVAAGASPPSGDPLLQNRRSCFAGPWHPRLLAFPLQPAAAHVSAPARGSCSQWRAGSEELPICRRTS